MTSHTPSRSPRRSIRTTAQADAVALLTKTAAAQPPSAQAQASLGTLLARQKLYNEAIEYFEKGIALDPSNDPARLSLAKALLALDRQQDALTPLNQVLARRPSDAEARELRGLVYRGLAEYGKAADDLKIATEINP